MTNKFIRLAIILVPVFFLVLACTSIAFSAKAPTLNNTLTGSFVAQAQETPTPPITEDNSEVGSTDGIIIMGGVIAVIVLLPILLHRNAWVQDDQP